MLRARKVKVKKFLASKEEQETKLPKLFIKANEPPLASNLLNFVDTQLKIEDIERPATILAEGRIKLPARRSKSR